MDSPRLSPQKIFESLGAFRRTAALRTAIELDVFTAIGESPASASEIAKRCSASERGIEKLCNYLTMLGFLERRNYTYLQSRDSAAFLDRRSPAYLAASASEAIMGEAFSTLTEAVRRGGTVLPGGGTLAPEHPVWMEFARAMAIPGMFLARMLADGLQEPVDRPRRILDIAAGHGLYGIEFAKRNPRAEIFAVEWQQVLDVALGNAVKAGVSERFHSIPGDAHSVELGGGYDLALITNFLPDLGSTEDLLKRTHSALGEDRRVA